MPQTYQTKPHRRFDDALQFLKQLCGGGVLGVLLEIRLENKDGPLFITAEEESPRQERLGNARLAVTQFDCALCVMDGLVQQALPQASLGEDRMRAPGCGFGFHGPSEVLSRFVGPAFPHEGTA